MVYGNIVINKKKYNKQHVIPLEGVTLEDLQDQINDSNKNGWLIKTPHKSFAVYAATSTEKQEWMAHINKCIDELLKRSKYLKNSTHFNSVISHIVLQFKVFIIFILITLWAFTFKMSILLSFQPI
jgi:hypothetical protein